MKRAGVVAAFTHDLTHRGWSAWILSSVLLGFYFGLYLSAESKQLAAVLGIARRVSASGEITATSAMHLRVPGLGALAASLGLGAPAAVLRALFLRRDAGALSRAAQREAALTGARCAALSFSVLYTSLGFASLLEPEAHDGRHLLLSEGHRWPTGVLVALLAPLGIGALASLAHALGAAHDRGALLRRLSVTLSLAFAALAVLLYGTHVFDPGAAPAQGDHSVSALLKLLYLGLDSKWNLYGLVYTMSVTAGGVFMLGRYGHNPYQVVRTSMVVTVQATLAFSVPVLLGMFQQPQYYLSYFWPLKIDAFYPDNIFRDPAPFVLWSFLGSLLLVPLLGVFFGKRWYCSWVCGCGGLANTAGEPWRHLSQKGESAWRFERAAIHSVLALSVVTTVLVIAASFMGEASHATGVYWSGHGPPSSYTFDPTPHAGLVSLAARARYYYGLIVVAVLSGAIGVGLYPLGGTRQWCRNFCPMAALLGLVQKFGRYRIRVKKDMCISCGMCTKYCEMGIDVRAYAQANTSFTRASCVGCGMCAEVCPRGVLSLEQRFERDPQERPQKLVQLRLRKDA